MAIRRVFMKDKTVLALVQAQGVTSDWFNSPMAIYVDDWGNVPLITQGIITNTILAAAGYTFDHDETI